MSYEWTAEQRAKLVPGATVSVDGERVEPMVALSFIDPASLRPPTLTWLRKMARRKLGSGTEVGLCGVGGAVVATCDHVVVTIKLRDGGVRWAGEFRDLPHLDSRSSCALWLEALPEVRK